MNLKKILALIFCICFLTLSFTACDAENYDDAGDTLVCIDVCPLYDYRTFYDKETNVMYVSSEDGVFSPLYNADGTLKTYHKSGSSNDN